MIYLAIGNVPPAIGDIKLQKIDDTYYQVLVYYSNGIDKPEYRGICSDVEQTVGITICRQLGYQYLRSTARLVSKRSYLLKNS